MAVVQGWRVLPCVLTAGGYRGWVTLQQTLQHGAGKAGAKAAAFPWHYRTGTNRTLLPGPVDVPVPELQLWCFGALGSAVWCQRSPGAQEAQAFQPLLAPAHSKLLGPDTGFAFCLSSI